MLQFFFSKGPHLLSIVGFGAFLVCAMSFCRLSAAEQAPMVLSPERFEHYVEEFNHGDEELYVQHVPDAQAWDFLRGNIPFFECPDDTIERTYYFRWWTFRKHIKETPDGFVITEFLPDVKWAGKHNAISCPAGHHFYEGRWLHEPKYLKDYAIFWFRKGGEPRRYSFWAANALWAWSMATGDYETSVELLDDLIANYEAWEKGFDWRKWRIGQRENGLFWTLDDRDGGEISVGGHGFRPTLNSYMYGDAVAIAAIARRAKRGDIVKVYEAKAARLRSLVLDRLWDARARFFKVLPEGADAELKGVRELYGFTPWYFYLPEAGQGYEAAWKQLMDPKGFYAPFGPATTEQRHPGFTISYEGHPCQWNGPSWPYATSITLTAMANVLNDYEQNAISRRDYFEMVSIYANCHRRRQNAVRLACKDGAWQVVVPAGEPAVSNGKIRETGSGPCWIDENLNPYSGDWLARTRLEFMGHEHRSVQERGKDYNHSSFCDLIISGLVGLRPQEGGEVVVNPLVPEGVWDWFCLDNVPYHGRTLRIIWDATGKKYGRGTGLRVFADGREIAHGEKLGRVVGRLP